MLPHLVLNRLRESHGFKSVIVAILIQEVLSQQEDIIMPFPQRRQVNGIFLQIYFGPLFSIPIKVLGADKAGVSNGVGNMFANIGGLSIAYFMGVIKDYTGSFEYGFNSICGICIIGLILAVILSRFRALKP